MILLSSRAGEEAKAEGMEFGADDYLVKPFSPRELTTRVGTHLELQAVRNDLATKQEFIPTEDLPRSGRSWPLLTVRQFDCSRKQQSAGSGHKPSVSR